MSDIAMLVAEEYERRVKISGEEVHLFSTVSIMASRQLDGFRFMVKKRFGDQSGSGGFLKNLQIVKREPKSQMGLAAIDGSFSA